MAPVPRPSVLTSTAAYLPPACLRNTNAVDVLELVKQIATAVLLEFQRPVSSARPISLVDRPRGKALTAAANKAASGRDCARATQAKASSPNTAMSNTRFTLLCLTTDRRFKFNEKTRPKSFESASYRVWPRLLEHFDGFLRFWLQDLNNLGL